MALYTLLKALGVGPGDEVIIPGFTCVVVPNAVLYLGATPVYADIEADTYNLSAATVEPLISPRTKAIVAQNTFGLSADLDPIMTLARRHNLMVIEDCAHGLGGHYRGRPNGTVAHAAFFSTQWSKPISTGLGGVAYTQDNSIAQKIEQALEEMKLPGPGLGQQAILGMQLLLRPLADQPALHYPLIDAYRFLTQKLGLSVGSSSSRELETIKMSSGYGQRMGNLQRWGWKYGLSSLEAKTQERQKTAAQYDDFFAKTYVTLPYRPGYALHAMLRYTIRVPDKAHLLNKARKLRIPVGDWFVSPLHPVTGDLSQWGYRPGQCPVAEQVCREAVNLLTDQPLSQRQLAVLFDGIPLPDSNYLSYSLSS